VWQQNRQNEKARKDAAKKVLLERGNREPSPEDLKNVAPGDVLKVLLAQECGNHCPYRGRSFSMNELVGPHPTMEVEHIIPFSRCLDDSFVNKTLCDADENRHRKRNRTPFEAYGGTPQYKDILARVRDFKSRAKDEKLRRFLMENIDSIDDFASRQLNDTRYAATQATDYLAVLYGGQYEKGGKRFIQASRGGVTAYLRNEWQLNSILGDGGTKSRDDHRHHAVDAVVTALTEPRTIKMLSDAAERAAKEGRRRFGRVEDPWPGFLQDVRAGVEAAKVSHRVSRKVNGRMHKDTNYAEAGHEPGRPKWKTHRKLLKDLTLPEVDAIVPESLKAIVRAKLAGGKPEQVFKSQQNHPVVPTPDGRKVPVYCVHLKQKVTTFDVGRGVRLRHVPSGANHHVEIFKLPDKNDKPQWYGRMVPRHEAMRRLAKEEKVVNDTPDPDKAGTFLFSLASGDLIELDADGGRGLFAVRTVSQSGAAQPRVEYVGITDARKAGDLRKSAKNRDAGEAQARSAPVLNTLAGLHCRKVIVTPLGEVRYARD
jgi:CRISPR-associated endonuclease Csn1